MPGGLTRNFRGSAGGPGDCNTIFPVKVPFFQGILLAIHVPGLGPTKVLLASFNFFEGTLPKLVNSGLQALHLSGVAGRSTGSRSKIRDPKSPNLKEKSALTTHAP